MPTTVRAVYENQVLRLDVPLSIEDGTAIEVTLNLPEPIPSPGNAFPGKMALFCPQTAIRETLLTKSVVNATRIDLPWQDCFLIRSLK